LQIWIDVNHSIQKLVIQVTGSRSVCNGKEIVDTQTIGLVHAEMNVIMGKALAEMVTAGGKTGDQVELTCLQRNPVISDNQRTTPFGNQVDPGKRADDIFIDCILFKA